MCARADPLPDRVIVWTKVTPASRADPVVVSWEVASDKAFTQVAAKGNAVTSAEVDFTVKVDATGLNPATSYYYRFSAGSVLSPIGTTKTLPAANADVSSFKLGVVRCVDARSSCRFCLSYRT